MKLFSFFKKEKPVTLSPIQYDELVDSKVKNIQEFVKSYVSINVDDKDFEDKIGEAFKMYLHKLTLNVYATGAREDVVLSPVHVLILAQTERKKRVKIGNPILRFINYLKYLKSLIILYFMTLGLRWEARKIQKLFPKGYMSSQTAVNLMKSVELNKKVMKIKAGKIRI